MGQLDWDRVAVAARRASHKNSDSDSDKLVGAGSAEFPTHELPKRWDVSIDDPPEHPRWASGKDAKSRCRNCRLQSKAPGRKGWVLEGQRYWHDGGRSRVGGSGIWWGS